MTLKASGQHVLAETIGPLLGPDTPVAFVQNGIPWWYGHGLTKSRPPAPDLSRLDPGGALAKAVGLDHVVGAVVSSPNHVVEPGVVHNEVPDRNILWVGEPDDRTSPRIEALRAALKSCRHRLAGDPDIRYEIWHKLMANLTGSTVCLVTGQPALVQKTPLVNRLSRRAHAEALAVAAAHGVVLDDHPDTRYGPKRVYTQPSPIDPAGLRSWPADGDRIDRTGASRLRPQRWRRYADPGCDRIDLCDIGPCQRTLLALAPVWR